MSVLHGRRGFWATFLSDTPSKTFARARISVAILLAPPTPLRFSIRSGRPKLRYANSTPCFMNGLFATCRDFFPRRISSWKRPSSFGETGIYAVASCLDSHLCLVCLDAFRIATEYPYIHVSHMQLVHVVSPRSYSCSR